MGVWGSRCAVALLISLAAAVDGGWLRVCVCVWSRVFVRAMLIAP